MLMMSESVQCTRVISQIGISNLGVKINTGLQREYTVSEEFENNANILVIFTTSRDLKSLTQYEIIRSRKKNTFLARSCQLGYQKLTVYSRYKPDRNQ